MSSQKPSEPYVPILCHPAPILRLRKKVIVVINESVQDLGIWAYRIAGHEGGIPPGSFLDFIFEVNRRSRDPERIAGTWDPVFTYPDELLLDQPVSQETQKAIDYHTKNEQLRDPEKTLGLIFLNTGQLLYSHRFNEAMSHATWNALPRESIVHPPVRKSSTHNTVPGNATPEEHVRFVFENIVSNPDYVAEDAQVYVIAISDGAQSLLEYLNGSCKCRFQLNNDDDFESEYPLTHKNISQGPLTPRGSRPWRSYSPRTPRA